MVTPHEARERLKVFHDSDERRKQLLRLNRLATHISQIGQIVIQYGPAWKKVSRNRRSFSKRGINLSDQLGRLTAEERLSLFSALYPQLAPQIEATWKLFDRLPYQTSYHRRPFRISDRSSAVARVFWLEQLVHTTKGYGEQNVAWFAAWASHLGYGAPHSLGYLFAGSMEEGGKIGQEVFDILISSANGVHEIGMMGRHVVQGLLCSSRQDGWEVVERMLLAAQREEGLRQVILESVDEAHPRAFRRILQIILDHNLSRFSSAKRAFNVWFGLSLENAGQKAVNQILAKVLLCLDSPEEQRKAIKDGGPEEAYFALWAIAFENALEALPLAIQLRQSEEAERRFVATHLIAQINLESGMKELLNALEDDDLRVVCRALTGLGSSYNPYSSNDPDSSAGTDLFERLERLLGRLPHKQTTLKPLVWDWIQLSMDRGMILSHLVSCLGKRRPKRLLPYLPLMDPNDRARVTSLLKGEKYKDAETMQILLKLIGDPSAYVRQEALKSVEGYSLKETDVIYLEGLLSRRPQDLRMGIIQLLLGLPDRDLRASLERLLMQTKESQRLAGLELLLYCKQKKRLESECKRLVEEYTQRRTSPTDEEKRFLEDLATQEFEEVSLENALGLLDPGNRTHSEPLLSTKKTSKLISHAAIACLKSLDQLVEEHRNDAVEVNRGNGKVTELLGNLDSPWIHVSFDPTDSQADVFSRLPLREAWENWWHARPPEIRDEDGLELIRALALVSLFDYQWTDFSHTSSGMPRALKKHFGLKVDLSLNYQGIVRAVLGWALRAHPQEGETDFILDALEESVASIPLTEMAACTRDYYGRPHRTIPRRKLVYLSIAHLQRELRPASWNNRHHARLWKIVRWIDEPVPGIPRHHPEIEDALYAFQAGAATRDDLLDLFLGPGVTESYGPDFQHLRQFSGRHPEPKFERFPILKQIVDICRERILEVELRRGNLPTAASAAAMNLRYVPGAQNLLRLLRALGNTNFERGYRHEQSRAAVISHLIRCCYPLETDMLDDFAQQVRDHHIPHRRLVELAVYAPQWSPFVQHAINWDHLDEAIWWLYAHTKGRAWVIEQDVRDEWAARISQYTPLSAHRLMDGGVDIAWFHRVFSSLGEEKWQEVYRAAEYASGGTGHTRARLFADAMLGKLSYKDVIERIRKKRHQDSVRALGLIPLLEASANQPEVLHRYEAMQEFLRSGKKSGSQRQANERLAVSIGMENLARTAGYRDPQRLEWAMEVESVSDLAQGPVLVQVGETTISLRINELGEPELGITKKGRPLKSLPTSLKKDERVSSLIERKQKLERQISRMRLSLEEAMCKADGFSGAELGALFRHPMLRAMIEQLVFVSDAGTGVPIRNGQALLHHSGKEIEVAATDALRIAHPVDLLQSNEWHQWQQDCFIAERIQPFKQVFRELYVVTSTEEGEDNISRRYAGQQINHRQAVALFGARGWVVDPSEGVQKTFHEAGISVRVGFLLTAFTPAEVEGPTIESVVFTNRGDWKPLPLESIPARVFSEVMRDVDLVVSVAHAGGIDPESSASSIEARSALIRETSALLNLANVQVSSSHAIVNGSIGNYNVHLGSGVVHKQPGGALCMIPVHAQQRGRLFLPFVDNDPKTAEIVSKVLLLARDDQIKDPTILEQILST